MLTYIGTGLPLKHSGTLNDAIVTLATVVVDDLLLALEGQAILGYPLDLNPRRDVLAGLVAARAGGGAAQGVAVHLPDDPVLRSVVEVYRVDHAATRVVAD